MPTLFRSGPEQAEKADIKTALAVGMLPSAGAFFLFQRQKNRLSDIRLNVRNIRRGRSVG